MTCQAQRLSRAAFYLLLSFLFGYCIYQALSSDTDDYYHRLTLDDVSDMPPLMVGDVVFRLGIGTDSEIIASMGESMYSHVGLVIATNPIAIIHASTNDKKDSPKQVIISDLSEFLAHSLSIAIKRYNLTQSSQDQIPSIAKEYVGRAFVLGDKDDKETLYCTTLVAAILQDFAPITPHYRRVSLVNMSYYFPQSLFADSNSTLIYSKD